MKLVLSHSAQKDLDKLPDNIALKVSNKIFALSKNPYIMGNIKLEGDRGYRIRVGDYRVVYTVDKQEKLVTIVKVAHRKEVYK